MSEKGVLARRYFYPGCHRAEPYRTWPRWRASRLRHTELVAARVLQLPTGTAIDQNEIATIATIMRIAMAGGPALARELTQPCRAGRVDDPCRSGRFVGMGRGRAASPSGVILTTITVVRVASDATAAQVDRAWAVASTLWCSVTPCPPLRTRRRR
jgi:DegT/DnrJ/EryC1/StrS aminotransferase family